MRGYPAPIVRIDADEQRELVLDLLPHLKRLQIEGSGTVIIGSEVMVQQQYLKCPAIAIA
jgi:hypothetical protein